jgi:hypothetical protein
VYKNAKLEHTVAKAKWLRDRVHLVGKYMGIDNASETRLDDLSTNHSPMVRCLLETFATSVDDASKLLIEFEIPESLIRLSMSAVSGSLVRGTILGRLVGQSSDVRPERKGVGAEKGSIESRS